jgi:CDP-diacylglycerol--serine O-phosphatidyltransferase
MNEPGKVAIKSHFRAIVERNGWLKAIPNALTLCNSLCGFAAILYTLLVYDTALSAEKGIEEILAVSAWMILFAMVFDALDGFAARIFNAASLHGVQMDSLADMVTFGVAPATLVAVMAHSMHEYRPHQFLGIWFLCAIYLGCARSAWPPTTSTRSSRRRVRRSSPACLRRARRRPSAAS